MAPRDLRGASVYVTGAGGGLGAALARRFAAAGARVGLLDVDPDRLHACQESLRATGATVAAVPCDVTQPAGVAAAMAQLAGEIGEPDVLVNNAGISHRSAFVDTEPEVLRQVMDVNFFGAVHCTRAVLAQLRSRRGAVVAISSVAGFAPLLGRAGYVASKHALHGLFGTLRAELRDSGVDVILVAPTFVDTDLRYRTLDGDGTITRHPQSRVGRMLSPEAVAAAVVQAVERRRPMVVMGAVGKISRLAAALAPRVYLQVMARSLRSELDRPGGRSHQ